MRRRLLTVIALVAGLPALAGCASPSAPDGAAAASPGQRLVGLGHAAVAVPERWGTNRTRCGVPQHDTVVIDVAAVPLCGTARPDGVESVEVRRGPAPSGFRSDESVRVDGVAARRQRTTCAPGDFGGGRVCSATLYLPSARVSFHAESSTGPAAVDRVLEQVRVVPARVGVPGFQGIALRRQDGAREHYVALLRREGLRPEVRTRSAGGAPAGFVLGVSPAPGTMVSPGTVVTVRVAG